MDKKEKKQLIADLELAIILTETYLKYSKVPDSIELYKRCLKNYKTRLKDILNDD